LRRSPWSSSTAEVPDAGAFLRDLVVPTSDADDDPTLEAALTRARGQELGEARAAAWAALAFDEAQAGAPVAPLLNRRRLQLVGPRVQGFVWSARGKGLYYGMLSLGER
jgi:hypothetical protein